MTTMLIPSRGGDSMHAADAVIELSAYLQDDYGWLVYSRARGTGRIIDIQTFANRAEVTEYATRVLNS